MRRIDCLASSPMDRADSPRVLLRASFSSASERDQRRHQRSPRSGLSVHLARKTMTMTSFPGGTRKPEGKVTKHGMGFDPTSSRGLGFFSPSSFLGGAPSS